MPDADEGDLLVFESRGRLLKLAAVSLIFVAIGGALVTFGNGGTRPLGIPVPLVGWACLAFFGLCLVYFSWRLVVASRSPLLRLTADGFYDETSMGGTFVRWDDLASLEVVSFGTARCVAGRVHDPDRLQSQRSGLRRVVARANRRFADIWIADGSLPMTAGELRDLMVERWLAAGGSEGPTV